MVRSRSFATVLISVFLAGACASPEPEPDAEAQAACAFWAEHVDRLFTPEIIVSERHELAEEFVELAAESETSGFSEAAATYAAAGEPLPEVSLGQRDFDAVVDRISQVCDVDRPEYPARELD